MIPRLALPTLLLAASTGFSLDISGIVLNKAEQPIPLAQVCLKNNPSRCANTSINGTFRLVDASSLRRSGTALGYAMEIRGNRLTLSAPEAARVRLEWLDPSGRALAPARPVELGAGRTSIALPDLPRSGLHILRVTAPDRTLTWKVLLLGGAAESRSAGNGPSLSVLSKAAAISELLVTKTGFRPALYLPAAEVENDAVIFLTANSDSGFVYTSTFKAKNIIDKAKGTLFTEATYEECDGDKPVPTTVKDTVRYAVRDGKYYEFYDGNCRAEVYSGTSAEAVGTWTATQSNVYLPQDLRPAACRDTVPASSVPATVKAVMTIGETEQSYQITSEVCPPDLYLGLISVYLLSDTTIELTKNTCRALTFKNGKGEEATLNFARRGSDSLASSFAFKTSTCATVENMRQGEGVATDCSGNDPVFTLLECIAGTGYFGEPPGPVAAKATASVPFAGSRNAVPRLPISLDRDSAVPYASGRASVSARATWSGRTGKSALLSRAPHRGGRF